MRPYLSSLPVFTSIAAILGWTATAAASASPPPPPPPPPLAAVAITGPAIVREATLEVDCEDASEALPAVRCAIVARFELLAVDALEVQDARRGADSLPGLRARPIVIPPDDHVWLDGVLLEEPRSLAAGETVQVELSTNRTLAAHARRRGYNFIVPPMRLRHVLFGGGLEPRLDGEGLSGSLVEGDAIRVHGGLRVDVHVPDVVEVRVDGAALEASRVIDGQHLALVVTFDPPWHPPAVVQPGGPMLALGGRFRDLDGHARFFLRLGYEWGLARYVFVSGTVASDFDSLLESVVVEAATPMLLLLPGVAAGVGVVARQFGTGRADAALRLHLGANLPVAGVTIDFDYWPSRDVWTGTLAARFSL